jgi:hypothetical protein
MPRLVLACLLLAGAAGCSSDDPLTAPAADLGSAKPGGSGSTSDTPVTTTIDDADSAAVLHSIRSDGAGAYHNSAALVSVVQTVGAWLLDSKSPRRATRRVFLSFDRPVAGTETGAPPPSGPYPVRMISKCHLNGYRFQDITSSDPLPCPLHIAFDHDGVAYALQMNDSIRAGGSDADGAYPDTDPAQVACAAAADGRCAAWRVASRAGGGHVAKLLRYRASKGRTVREDRGNFVVSFGITVTNP